MKVIKLAAAAAVALAGTAVTAGAASATPAPPSQRNVCTGTLQSPGVLAGTFNGTVRIQGVCVVNGGPANIHGNLVLAPGSALNATFALNDVAGAGTSSLNVQGNVLVRRGAVLGMGCEPKASPCSDDANAATGGYLTGQDHVQGNLEATNALAVITHASSIGGSVTQIGGGGGLSCAVPTTGIFSLLKSPVFSDYEDNTIGGSLVVNGVTSCYFGDLRNQVAHDLSFSLNRMGDPDANEVLSNPVGGDIACIGDVPAVHYGDSQGLPNLVVGKAFGQCSFSVFKPRPAPSGPLFPIAVHI